MIFPSNALADQRSGRHALIVEIKGSNPFQGTGSRTGGSSNGKIAGLQLADEGSTPSTVHCFG